MSQIKQHKFIIIGTPGAGKSTFAHLLLEKPLVGIDKDSEYGFRKKFRLNAQESLPNDRIEHGLLTRGTSRGTSIFDWNHNRIIFDFTDFYNDSEQAYTFPFYTLLENGNFHIICMADINEIYCAHGRSVAELLTNLTELFPVQEELKKGVSLVFSKTKQKIPAINYLLNWCDDGKAKPDYLSDRAFQLLKFFVENPNRMASFDSPTQVGPYTGATGKINHLMKNCEFVKTPHLCSPVREPIISHENYDFSEVED